MDEQKREEGISRSEEESAKETENKEAETGGEAETPTGENAYEFLKETIKEKPIDKKKLAQQAGKLAGAGAVFGLAAALVFALTEPGIARQMEKSYESRNIRYQDEEETPEEQAEDKAGEEAGGEEAQEEQTTTVVQKMTLEDYQDLYSEMSKAAEEAKKSIVTVIGSQNDKDWFQTPYESQISGLIVAESGQDLYILTEYRIVENVDRIQVVFCDGTMTDARFQKSDDNTGFAVLKIPQSEISTETKNAIAIAPLGDSYNVKQGQPVLAIGSPMGYSNSVGYGIVTSTSNTVSKVDAEYSLLTTDITGSAEGSGVIISLEGEIIGIIAQSFAGEDLPNQVTGLSVTQSRELIKMLTGDTENIYMGITGENISSEISEKKGIPKGVFVKEVVVDSPAMQVGIQNGDVIVEINGEKVETVKGYQQQLKACRAGSTIKVKAMRQGTEGYVEVSFDVTLKAK